VIKGKLGKMLSLSRRKQQTWLLGIYKRLRYSDFLASVFTGKCSSHATQDAEGKGRDWENEEPLALGEGKFLRPAKESEGAQVFGT